MVSMSYWKCIHIVSLLVNTSAFTITGRTPGIDRKTVGIQNGHLFGTSNVVVVNGDSEINSRKEKSVSLESLSSPDDGTVATEENLSAASSSPNEIVDDDKVNMDKLLSKKDGVDTINFDLSLPPQAPSPPLVFSKYVTMQTKRINVMIRYTGNAGLRPFFLTVAKYIKTSNPDVIIERHILPAVEGSEDATTFEVIVDGKVIIGKDRIKRQNISSSTSSNSNADDSTTASSTTDLANGMSVFVSMHEISTAISKARKKRRPSTKYLTEEDYELDGIDGSSSPRAKKLEMLRRSQESKVQRPLEQ